MCHGSGFLDGGENWIVKAAVLVELSRRVPELIWPADPVRERDRRPLASRCWRGRLYLPPHAADAATDPKRNVQSERFVGESSGAHTREKGLFPLRTIQ